MLSLALLLGSGRPATSPPAPGTLHVFTRFLQSGWAFTEGAVDHVVIEGEGGRRVLDDEFEVLDPAQPQITTGLPAGTYLFIHYQRPCNVTCDMLGPRVDECRRVLDMPPGALIVATVSIRVGNPCSIDLFSGT